MTTRSRTKSRATSEPKLGGSPKLVYTQAPVLLGKLAERTSEGWLVDLGAVRREVGADASVDPVLLDEALARGSRVLIDASGEPCIVGVVMTARAITIDPQGDVRASVRSFAVEAQDEVVLKVPGAFVRAMGREVEVYGERVVTRARHLAKILAAMIKLN
ncbi:MAG: hypothetical protein K8H88_12835 [Sandaracinaceae bacterium]|nr:hypothetical protein [Sandaracinaceae bacterium]